MDPAAAASADGGAFLEFVDYAISMLSSAGGDGDESPGDGPAPARPPWGWAVAQVLKSCCAYSSGVTAAIILSDLFQSWSEQRKSLTSKRKVELTKLINTRNKRRRLPNTVTIDSIHEKNFLSPKSVLEAVVIDVFVLPGTNIYMLTLGDMWSASTIDLYLHRRFYDYIGQYGLLKKGREVMLTGCCLRTAMEGSGHARILPTEYMVILLDEAKDEDAMLLAAQFCAYSFSSMISEENRHNVPYSFYARIEKIESLEPFRCTERKQIVLVDSDDTKMGFILWGEQVLLANLFSVGSMLALDRPYIANCVDSNHEESQELCLEYGSATQVYVVPIAQQEEQVYVNDLHDKMVGVSLFGTITSVCKASTSGTTFYLELEDTTGVALMKLIFTETWYHISYLSDGLFIYFLKPADNLISDGSCIFCYISLIACQCINVFFLCRSLGRLGVGHMVYISGLTCTMSSTNILEVSWREKEPGSLFVNLSLLPALLNSSCLHNLAPLSDLPRLTNRTHISPDEYLELPEVQTLKLVDRIMPK
nr:unnamed protein product [Digitaria exilis]